MSNKVRKYTNEFKQEAIALALKSPNSSKIASELGIPTSTLHTWIEKWTCSVKPSPKVNSSSPDVSTLIAENRRLHKELCVAKEEREILKKAAAFFAQHQK